jgi:hypothetical protein
MAMNDLWVGGSLDNAFVVLGAVALATVTGLAGATTP